MPEKKKPEHKSLVAAVMATLAEIPPIKKDKTNPEFGSSYASLSSIRESVTEPLRNNGLIVTAGYRKTDGEHSWVSVLRHTGGETLEIVVPIVLCASMWSVGSAITYAERYGLCSLLSLAVGDDDDGNAASTAAVKPPVAAKKPAAETKAKPKAKPKAATGMEKQITACQQPRALTLLLLRWASERPVLANAAAWKKIITIADKHIEAKNWPRSDDRDKLMAAIIEFEKELKGEDTDKAAK